MSAGERRLSFFALIAMGAFLLVLFAGWSVLGAPPAGESFRNGSNAYLDKIPKVDLREAKLRHAAHTERFDVGLFGNSRLVHVSRDDLGLGKARFFNFAVPGSSIRNSVSMLRQLAAVDRLPRTAIIGVDHFHLEYFENPEAYLIPERLELLAQDMSLTVHGMIPLMDGIRLGWRHAQKTWETFTTALNFSVVRTRAIGPSGSQGTSYALDGSRKIPSVQATSKIDDVIPEVKPSILPAVLEEDLESVRRLMVATGARIIVVELPIHPNAKLRGGRSETLRDFFFNSCRRIGTECLSLSGTKLPTAGWPDATHVPARALGRALADIVANPVTR